MRRLWFVLLPVVLLAGCSAATEDTVEGDALTGADLSDASSAQTEEIEDREATADEYQAAFQRYRECLSAEGFELTDVDQSGAVYEFGVPNAAVEDGADQECYAAEFRYVDMLWQTTDDVQNNSETAQVIRECLQERGIEPAGTLTEMNDQLRDAGVELPECLE